MLDGQSSCFLDTAARNHLSCLKPAIGGDSFPKQQQTHTSLVQPQVLGVGLLALHTMGHRMSMDLEFVE